MRTIIAAAAALSLVAGVPAFAAPCKDAKGRFVKCPEKPVKPARCKDAKGSSSNAVRLAASLCNNNGILKRLATRLFSLSESTVDHIGIQGGQVRRSCREH